LIELHASSKNGISERMVARFTVSFPVGPASLSAFHMAAGIRTSSSLCLQFGLACN